MQWKSAVHLKRCLMIAAAALLLLNVFAGGPVRAASCPEAAMVMRAGNAFLAAARTERASDFAKALETYTDMKHISLFALGKYRSALPPGRLNEFVDLSSWYVANTLANFARKFRALSIKFIECRGDKVSIRLEYGGSRAAKRAVFRVQGGKIVDVYIQNIWLALLLRDNYLSILNKNNGNIDALFAALKS